MLRKDKVSGECNNMKVKQGEKLFKLKYPVLAKEVLGIWCSWDWYLNNDVEWVLFVLFFL